MGRMDWFMKDFVTRMLNASADFYSNKASNWILEDSCPDYMLKAEECLKQEKKTFSNYLPAIYRNKLIERVQIELLVKHGSELLKKEASGFCALLHDDQVDNLSRMFRLFSQSPELLDCVESMFKQHVRAEIMPLVQQAEDAASNKAENAGGPQELLFCRKMVELHDKIMNYVTVCFNNHMHFQKVLKDAVRNTTMAGCSCAELLASYCDNILKKDGSQKLSDESIEQTLDEMVKLLAYVNHEDRFAYFYWKKLSSRLVFDKSASWYHEMWFLEKLKTVIGWQFMLKLERMVTDRASANETYSQINYHHLYSNSAANPVVDFKVNVLTPHSWPRYKTSNLTLPCEMATCVDIFKEFYKRNATPRNLASSDLSLGRGMKRETTGRELMWIYSLGKCKVSCTFEKKTIMLILGNYQAAALLLFNAADSLSFTDIKTQLNLDVEDVTRVLHSLSCAKYQILTKVPDTKDISQTDCFRFNSKFTDSRGRIAIPLPRLSSLVFERKQVEENREHAIDASIVRIMKCRKSLNFKQLVSECTAQLDHLFKPDLKAIKKRIDALIILGYMKRVEGDNDMFGYLA